MTLKRHSEAILMLMVIVLLGGMTMAAEQPYIQAKIFYDSPDQLSDLYKMNLDVLMVSKQYVEIVSFKQELDLLSDMGYETEIVHDDLVAFYKSRFPDKDKSGYLTLSQIESELFFNHILYPDITTDRISIGQTLEGRDIYAFKISDNPGIDEDEPEVLYTAAIHAREVITPLVLLHFMNYLLSNYGVDPEVTDLVNERELWFILVVNPDGYMYNVDNNWPGGMWRKNRRDNGDGTWGVDLNRNFGYEWAYDDAGSSPDGDNQTYRGTGPFSEPATQVLRDFITDHEFQITLMYHAHSNIYLWAYAYDNSFTPDEDIFQALSDSMGTFSGYVGGIGIIGYPVNGCASDWLYGEQTTKNKIFGYTVEVGSSYTDGFWPATYRIPELAEENLQGNLFIAKVAGNVESVLLPEMPVVTAPDSVETGTPYNIDWQHDDERNPAVYYELRELSDFQFITDSAENFDHWMDNNFEILDDAFYTGGASTQPRYIISALPYTILPDDTLRCRIKYNLNYGLDYAYVGLIIDDTLFEPLEGNVSTDFNPNGFNIGHGISGSTSNLWEDAYFDLSDYVGQEARFIFYYQPFDKAFAFGGIYFDDIYPTPAFENSTVISSTLTDTSYGISGNAEGAYFYTVRAQDADGQWSGYPDIEKVVVGNPVICVDSDGDGYGNPGIPGSSCPDDNCAMTYNPGQGDADNDGIGDACDNCTDTDGDGFGNPGFAANICDIDNCPDVYNPDQFDPDEDNLGTLCDNCPDIANIEQTDTDDDGLGDACDYLCADADGSWAINLLDVTFLIGYLYLGGPEPFPLEYSDVNNSGNINILDAVYLISYLYKGGPEPICP